jgi:hypothetical protein
MPIDPSIIGNVMAPQAVQMPDMNAMMQTQTRGMENIYQIEAAREAQAKEEAKAQEAEAIKALSPAIAAAFEDPSDAGLDAAFSLVPEEFGAAADEQLTQLRAIPDINRRKAVIRSALLQDDYGRALLAQLEPTANMRLQAQTAAGSQSLAERRLALDIQKAEAEAAGGGVSPDVAARLEFDREKFAAEQAEKAKIASGEAAPVQLQKGERWNPEKQRVEAVPGSQTYNKQKSTQAKDYSSAKNAVRELEKVRGTVKALKETTGYQKAMGTGAIMSNVPNTPLSTFTGAYDFQTKYKNLKGAVATLGRAAASLQGKLGNMAVQEWKTVSDAIANLDLESMSSAQLDDQLEIITNDLTALDAQVRDAYEKEWGDTQFYNPLEGEGPAETPGGEKTRPAGVGPDWTHMTDANGAGAWVSPDQKQIIEDQ